MIFVSIGSEGTHLIVEFVEWGFIPPINVNIQIKNGGLKAHPTHYLII